MFSGIVETQSQILKFEPKPPSAKLTLKKPQDWNDTKLGDSIAINGVCLTVESLSASEMQFTLGPETLQITNWLEYLKPGQKLNLERSLSFGDRMHGHMVPGHVDEMGKIENLNQLGDSLEIWISCSDKFKNYIWVKASVAVNGVSLTVNKIQDDKFQVVLIPESLRRTNLGEAKVGTPVCLEADFFSRGLIQTLQNQTIQQRGALRE